MVKFRNVGRKETEDVIPVTEPAMEKVLNCAGIMTDLEFGCVDCADTGQENDGRRIIVDFPVCFDQFVGPANCNLTEKGYNKNITEMDQQGLSEIGIAHGHGHMGPFHSGLDNTALKDIVVPCCFKNNAARVPPKRPEKQVSRVYSIVVNKVSDVYSEINYRIEHLSSEKKGQVEAHFKRQTAVVPVKGAHRDLQFTRDSLVRELVTKVFFPSTDAVPSAFKRYLEFYRSLGKSLSDDRLNAFAQKTVQYTRSRQNKHAVLVREFIERLDQHFAERIKFVYDPAHPEPHIRSLFAFSLAQKECPEWIPAFVDEASGPAQRKTFFSRKTAGSADVNDALIEKFADKLDSEFRVALDLSYLNDELDLESLTLQKAADKAQELELVSSGRINEHLAPVAGCVAGKPDLELIYGYAKLALLASAEGAGFKDLDKIMCPETDAVLRAKESEVSSIYEGLKAKRERLDELLAEKGLANLPAIAVSPVSFAQIKSRARSIANAERSDAHKFAENAMFFKESLPVNWARKYAGKAAEYVAELKQRAKTLARYEAFLPGVKETCSWLGKQERDLHAYVLCFFGKFERAINEYCDACQEHGQEHAEAKKAKSVVQEYSAAAKEMPSKPYWYHRNKMEKLLEAAENGK